jgi:hypothetical protein
VRDLWRWATLGAVVAAAALIGALLIETVPRRLQLWSDDPTAAAITFRLALLAAAAVILLYALRKGLGLWVDTLLLTAVGLAAYATGAAYWEAREPDADIPPDRVTFSVLAGSLDVSQLPSDGRDENDEVVLLVVRKEAGENGATTFATSRFEGKLDIAYDENLDRVPISIERGKDDSHTQDLASNLEQLEQAYLLPPLPD